MVTSNPTRTSPVKRGQFILDNILGHAHPAAAAGHPRAGRRPRRDQGPRADASAR